MAGKNFKTKTNKTKTNQKSNSKRSRRTKRQSLWDDDFDIGYATYDHESDYKSPTDLDEDKLDMLHNLNQRLATAPLFAEVETPV